EDAAEADSARPCGLQAEPDEQREQAIDPPRRAGKNASCDVHDTSPSCRLSTGDINLSNVKIQIQPRRKAVKRNLDIVKIAADISLMGKSRKKADVRSHMTATPRKAIAGSPAKPGGRRQRRVTPYHHGALREALLTAAEGILERDGMPGL